MSSTRNILITGATRGIGRNLTALWLTQANNTLIAGVRDHNADTAKSLCDLPVGTNSKLIVVKIDSLQPADPATAVDELRTKHDITRLDIVIANAGISAGLRSIAETQISDLVKHLEVNDFAVIRLFQATLPLLEQAKAPKWVSVSSVAGTLGDMHKLVHPNSTYGASKALLNFHTLKMHYEHEKLAVIALHPGWLDTEMGTAGAIKLGLEKPPQTLAESIPGIHKVVEAMTRETHGGKFWSFDGAQFSW